MTGLICSVEFECEEIFKDISDRRSKTHGGLTFYSGTLMGRPVLLVASGVGKTNAAHATTVMFERFSPGLVINFGVGGAFPGSGLGVCDIAVADKEIYGDEGVVTGKGFSGMKSVGLPILWSTGAGDYTPWHGSKKIKSSARHIYNEIPLDGSLVKKASLILKKDDLEFTEGHFVTLSAVTGTTQRVRELRRRYRAICENMEGAAVAHICLIYDIPFLEIRGISNIVEDRDRRKWKLGEAAAACQRAVMEVVKGM